MAENLTVGYGTVTRQPMSKDALLRILKTADEQSLGEYKNRTGVELALAKAISSVCWRKSCASCQRSPNAENSPLPTPTLRTEFGECEYGGACG